MSYTLNTNLEADSPVPMYVQLKQHLLAGIEAEHWRPGGRIPGDDELCALYSVSRTTVRQALKELENAELIVRYRGRGTFLATPKLSHGPAPSQRLSDNLRAQGIAPGWQVLEAKSVSAPATISAALGIRRATRVFRLKRLRLAGDEAIGLLVSHAAIPNTSLPRDALESGSSLQYLAGLKSLEGAQASRTIEALSANKEQSRRLGVEIGMPMLCVRRILSDPQGVAIEHLRATYRGDRFQYLLSGDIPPVVDIDQPL